MSMFTSTFVQDALERAVRTLAQVALSLLTVSGAGLGTLTSQGFISAVLLAGVISLLTSVVASNIGNKDSASVLPDVKP
jgi:hypothetical protein